ncbi:outer membrane receptor protein [Flammeovirgaceae bacterium 311]|nr:outer membrane receptor protein [Flammeovirgaceae bacterium 311]
MLCVQAAWAQVSVSGRVIDPANQPLTGVSIVLKGKAVGTVTDASGNFSLSLDESPPLTLVFSFIGYNTREVQITQAAVTDLRVQLAEEESLLSEVVVSASRVEESILESPVSIEKMNIREINETAAPSFYDAIKNLKGIDVSTQSITFSSINPRGFSANGNQRTVQLIDGIDNQAPGLNFPVGNITGITQLDLESVEILPGAASALYGPNAIQGIILMTSKSPFEYQGLSLSVKQGVNHVDEQDFDRSLYSDYGFRYAKAFNNKVAFKVTASYLKANDFIGVDYRDQNNIVELSQPYDPTKPGYRDQNRTYDGVNVYGEPLVNLGAVADGVIAGGGATGEQLAAIRPLIPNGEAGDFTPTGWTEREFVDNNTESLKLGGALHYKIRDHVELIGQYNIGFGSTIYTANDRFVLDDFSIWTGKLELRSKSFFARAYTTRENSGDTYAANTLASLMNAETYIPEYFQNFVGARVAGQSVDQAHAYARENTQRLAVGSEEYNEAFNRLRSLPISEGGAKFIDKTGLYHLEGFYNFTDKIDFAEIIVGGNYRLYDLNSEGTLFALKNIDTGEEFNIREYGGYVQVKKQLLNQRLDLTGSVRYDKNEYFKGQFSPRLAAVFNAGESRNHNIRASFQRGFRIPTTQTQFINLDVVSRRLVGNNEALVDAFNFRTNTVYNLVDLQRVRNGELSVDQLQPFTNFSFETEKVNTYEIGYRTLIQNKLTIDAYYYYSSYNDFITEVDLIQTATGNENTDGETPLYAGPAASKEDIVNRSVPLARYAFGTNADETINAHGWAVGAEYGLPGGFQLGGNLSYNELIDEEVLIRKGFNAFFNTPKWKYNLQLSNRNVVENLGFLVSYRWQDAYFWESSFGEGVIPAFGTMDAQLTYRLPKLKTNLRLGGTNVLNERYTTSFGNPRLGAIYYLGITFDEFYR